MKTDRFRTRRLAWALVAGASALLLTVGLSLLLTHFQVLAQPATEVSAANLNVQKGVSKRAALPGETVIYTITIGNTGDAATVWLTDVLHPDLAYVPDSLGQNHGNPALENGVLTWNGIVGGGQTVRIWFSAQISSETAATRIENTAQVTGTGALITDSLTTNVLADQQLLSQIRSPNKDAIITQKGSLPIGGIAWDSSIAPPYIVDDPYLSVQRVSDWSYYVRWTDVASATQYTLQEATQPDFSDQTPVETEALTYTLVSKGSGDEGTYYYRVQATRLDLEPSRWSNVESVDVPWTVATGDDVSVSALPAGISADDSITVEVRADRVGDGDDGTWHTAVATATDWGGWEWSYEWPLPEADDVLYTIQSRARYTAGTPGPIDTITVTLRNQNYIVYLPRLYRRWPPVPYPPTLNDIDNPGEDPDYTVTWSYPHSDPPVTSYTLQEAKDAPTDFVDVYDGTNTSYTFSDQEGGTYYYRVRGNNSYGRGEWSDVKSTSVRSSYRYDFDSPTKIVDRWPIRRTSYWQGDEERVTWTEEHGGSLYIIMDDRWDFTIASPFEEAPPPPYTIETRVRIHDPANLVAYGIIFGGNGGSPCPAYRDTGCLTHYYRLEVIWDGGTLKAGLKRIDYHESSKGKGRGKELISYSTVSGDPDQWHTWEFVVEDDGIDVYVDGAWFGSTGDDDYVNEPYFGVYASSDEYKPAIGRFDYFYVDPD